MPITQAKLINLITIAETYREYQDSLKKTCKELYYDPDVTGHSWQTRFEEIASLIHAIPVGHELMSELYEEKRHIIRTLKQNQYKREYMRRKRAEDNLVSQEMGHLSDLNLDLTTKQAGTSFAQEIEAKLQSRPKLIPNQPDQPGPYSGPTASGLAFMKKIGIPTEPTIPSKESQESRQAKLALAIQLEAEMQAKMGDKEITSGNIFDD